MKFLIDMPVSPALVDWLKERGHEGVHARDIGLDTASDSEIVTRARTESRIVISADLDFGRILALSADEGPGVILFRGGNYSEGQTRELLARVLASVSQETLAKAICVVDKSRVRVTRLPLKGKP
jgi:predicted nuclease of predicted toxin-antitoxin system